MNLPTIKDISHATKEVASKSAMNPIQWVCALTTPFSLIAAALTGPPVQWFFLAIAVLPIFYAIRVYEHFMKSDPDRLHSERYLLERQIVGKIGKNVNGEEIVIELRPESPSENPRLSHEGDEK